MHYFDNEAAWEAFRAEAESWLGTPYRHLQRCKGRGADCTLFVGQALRYWHLQVPECQIH